MMKMKGRFVRWLLFSVAGILFSSLPLPEIRKEREKGEEDAVYPVLFWNLENFFDPFDDSLTADGEFTPAGERHWTWKRFLNKRDRIAKTLIATRDVFGAYPAIAAFAECENRWVLRQLVHGTPLDRLGYRIVHRDSPDRRGIDVALIYREETFKVLEWHNVPVNVSDRPTRDLLHVTGTIEGRTARDGADTLDLFVVHFPSRFGGSRQTAPLREKAARILKEELLKIPVSPRRHRMVLGDFNDGPLAPSLAILCDTLLHNLARDTLPEEGGTVRYGGRWELLDQILVSPSLLSGQGLECSPMRILSLPHLLEKDEKFLGWKPFRTFYGPMYHGGISDHLPVGTVLRNTEGDREVK